MSEKGEKKKAYAPCFTLKGKKGKGVVVTT